MRVPAARVLPVLAAAVLLLQASLLFRPDLRTLDRPLTEDGYYALTIARNIAHGLGATADGVRATNGFQPLFTLLTVPLFWLTRGLFAPLRGLLLLHLVVQWATARVLASVAREAARGIAAPVSPEESERRARAIGELTAFLYLVAVNTFLQHWNGLETGFVLFLLAVAWRADQRLGDQGGLRGAVTLGITLGLCVLARIDTALLVAVVCLAEWAGSRGRAGSPRRALAIGAAAFAISLPWWLYNFVGFGSLMPTSGSAQQEFAVSGERIGRMITAVLADALPWIYARRGGDVAWDVLRIAVLAPIAWLVARTVRDARAGAPSAPGDDAIARTTRFGGRMIAFAAVLAAWYCASSWASHFYVRYLAPLIPVATLAAAFAAWRLTRGRTGPVAAACAALVLAFAFVVVALHQGRVFGRNDFYAEQLALVRRHVPDAEWVASGQTGTLGYFRDHVLNLDGKVNPEAFAARADIAGYVRRQGIRWFCDEPWFAEHWFGAHPESNGWRLVSREGAFVLYRFTGPS